MERHDLVRIDWMDAQSSSNWYDEPEDVPGLVKCVSFGKIVRINETEVVLAGTFSEDFGYNQTIAIPIAWILDYWIFTEVPHVG